MSSRWPQGPAPSRSYPGPRWEAPDRAGPYRASEAPPAPRGTTGPAQGWTGRAGESGPPVLTEVIEREATLVRGTRLEALGPEVHSRRHDGGTQTLPGRRAPYAGRPADHGAGPAGAPSTSSGEPPLMSLDLEVQGPPPAPRPRPSCPGPAPGLRKAGTLSHLLCRWVSYYPRGNTMAEGPAVIYLGRGNEVQRGSATCPRTHSFNP